MLRIDRGLVQNFDWRVFGLVALLLAMGLLNLSSATATEAGGLAPAMRRQLVALGVGAVIFVVAVVVDYRRLERFAPLLYLGSLVLLAATLVFGQEVGGNRSWLVYGPLRLQPAEFAKVAMVKPTLFQRSASGSSALNWSWRVAQLGSLPVRRPTSITATSCCSLFHAITATTAGSGSSSRTPERTQRVCLRPDSQASTSARS